MRSTTLTQLVFKPVNSGIALDPAAGVIYTTPQVMREQLLNMAYINGLQAIASFYLESDSTGGTATVRLTDGVNACFESAVDLSQASAGAKQIVDLSQYTASSFLFWEIETTVAGSAGSVGEFSGKLTIQTPLVVSASQC